MVSGSHVPMLQRRPAVQYNMAKIITRQVAGLMFGDEQAPTIRCWDQEGNNPYEALERTIETIVDRCDLEAAHMQACLRGSVGSSAIVYRSTGGKKNALWWEVLHGKYARPVFSFRDPEELEGLVQIYPTTPEALIDAGYKQTEYENDGGIDLNVKHYWMRIELDAREERRFIPLTDEDYQRLNQKNPVTGKIVRWVKDDERSAFHKFGVVPAVWFRNLSSDGIDGDCTFADIVDIQVEIDYLLSQIGRGFRYTAEPLLAIARGELGEQNIGGPVGESTQKDDGGRIIKSGENVLELESGAKAEMLEITGGGLEGAREHVKQLREYAFEVLSGLKSSAENEKGVQSGRALDILSQSLVLLVKMQRIPYGNRGLIPSLRVVMTGIKAGAITVPDVKKSDVKIDVPMRLHWPAIRLPSGSDLLAEMNALEIAAGGSQKVPVRLLGTDTVTRLVANKVGVTDANMAVKEREASDTEDQAKAEEQAQAEADRSTDAAVTVAKAKPAPTAKPAAKPAAKKP